MIDLEIIKNRVRQILDDADGNRFKDDLLESAIRLAVQAIDERIPLVFTMNQAVTSPGRDQSVTGLEKVLYLIQLTLLPGCESKGLEFTYTLQNSAANLHFSGTTIPESGQTLQLKYAAQNTLTGLDGATATTLPEACAAALEFGGAGYACLLRAAALSETYGARPGEPSRLVDQSRVWLDHFSQALRGLRSFQQFGFPSGFAFDQWDQEARPPCRP